MYLKLEERQVEELVNILESKAISQGRLRVAHLGGTWWPRRHALKLNEHSQQTAKQDILGSTSGRDQPTSE